MHVLLCYIVFSRYWMASGLHTSERFAMKAHFSILTRSLVQLAACFCAVLGLGLGLVALRTLSTAANSCCAWRATGRTSASARRPCARPCATWRAVAAGPPAAWEATAQAATSTWRPSNARSSTSPTPGPTKAAGSSIAVPSAASSMSPSMDSRGRVLGGPHRVTR